MIWLLCEPSRVPGGLELPQALAEKMLVATRFLGMVHIALILCPLRLHVDTDLDERVQYILKTYEYICKVGSTLIFLLLTTVQDETNFARILSTVEKYAGKRSGESWEDLQSRSNYKELVTEPTQDSDR